MKIMNPPHAILVLALLTMLFAGCEPSSKAPETSETAQAPPPLKIGGSDVVTLRRAKTGDNSVPEFLSATVLPGRGMNLFGVTAYLPGKGEIQVIDAPKTLAEAAQIFTGQGDDATGNKSFTIGGAFLAPFANRIVGKVSPDGKTITTEWHGNEVTLPANWKGKLAAATPHAMHGLILNSSSSDVSTTPVTDGQSVTGQIHGGDFDGRWFSKNDFTITEQLTGKAVDISVTVKNVGDKAEPVGVGWHPYFAIPSGDRTQARLYISGDQRTVVNNYDDVFATGKLVPVKGTPYDFTKPGGSPLGKQYLDDNWTNLKKDSSGSSVSEIVDPAAHYGLRIVAVSPQINAVQVYSPPDKAFIALEPQFNLNDPFGKEWKGRDTRMVTLKPGESVTWKVRLELFVPAA